LDIGQDVSVDLDTRRKALPALRWLARVLRVRPFAALVWPGSSLSFGSITLSLRAKQLIDFDREFARETVFAPL
jgi:hypothetical protein